MNQLKLRNNLLLIALCCALAIIPFYKSYADQYYPPSGGGGTVMGDGVVEATSAPGGQLALANAAAYTFLGNNTASATAPTYAYGLFGFQTISATTGTVTLTKDSPSVNYINGALSTNLTLALPQVSTCPGKVIEVLVQSTGVHSVILTTFAGDTIINAGAGTSSLTLPLSTTINNNGINVSLVSTGGTTWVFDKVPILSLYQGGTGFNISTFNTGGLLYENNASQINQIAPVAVGSVLISNGVSGAPIYSATPGSATALTSLTNIKNISAGTSPGISDGGTSGSGGTTAFVGTAHDESGQFTVTAGTGATACVVTITYGGSAYASTPNVVFSNASSAAAGIIAQEYISAQSGTAFSITLGALAPAGVYTYNYHVKQ